MRSIPMNGLTTNPLPTTRSFPSPTYTDVLGAEHELWHPNYLQAIKTAIDRLRAQPSQSRVGEV